MFQKVMLAVGLLVGGPLLAGEVHFYTDSKGLPVLQLTDETGGSAVGEIIQNMQDSRLAVHAFGKIEDFYNGTLLRGIRSFTGSATVLLKEVAHSDTKIEEVGGFLNVEFGGEPAFELFGYAVAVPENTRGNNGARKYVRGRFFNCSIQTLPVLESKSVDSVCSVLVAR